MSLSAPPDLSAHRSGRADPSQSDSTKSRRPAALASYVSSRARVVAGYGAGVVTVALCLLFSLLGAALLHSAAFLLVFPLGVIVVAARFGVGPAVLTAVTGVLVFDFVFVPPLLSLSVRDRKDLLTLVAMLIVGAAATLFAERVRRQVDEVRRKAELEGLRNAVLSALSHDLRTPLVTLVGASTALHEEHLEPPERREYSRMVADEAARLSRLVTNLLHLTRLESGRVTATSTLQAIDEVIGSALVRSEPRLRDRPVRTNVPHTLPLVAFDPVLIEQVLLNLLDNVVRHTPDRSPVEITAQSEGDELLVDVADRGPGVPADQEERVFEKLHRISGKADGGIGLGLTICRAIITAHQGRIWLENRSGGGIVVRFTLPLRRPAVG